MSGQKPDSSSEFLRLLLGHERRIYAFIRSLVPSAADADDLLQETSTVLWKKFDQFQLGSDFAAWATQIAWHEVRNYRRRHRRDRLQFDDRLIELLADTTQQQCESLSDMQDALEHCLSLLSSKARELLLSRYETGASVEKLAQEAGRPIQTLYSSLKRIRRTIFECVQRTMRREMA